MNAGKTVFVCYRRADEPGYVARLCDDLRECLSVRIIQDRDFLKGGENWAQDIEVAISESAIVLVVIGRHWQQELEKRNSENDEVRKELALARLKEIPVLPILLNETKLPDVDSLAELSWLLSIQHFSLIDTQDRWPLDINSLAGRITELTGAPPEHLKPRRSWPALLGIPGVLLMLIIFAANQLIDSTSEPETGSYPWVLNWNRISPEHPYDHVRHTASGGKIVSSDRLIRILQSLSLPDESSLNAMRDSLSARIETAPKVDTDNHEELRGFEQYGLDVNYTEFESDWSDLRAAIKNTARNNGVGTDGQ